MAILSLYRLIFESIWPDKFIQSDEVHSDDTEVHAELYRSFYRLILKIT